MCYFLAIVASTVNIGLEIGCYQVVKMNQGVSLLTAEGTLSVPRWQTRLVSGVCTRRFVKS
jgi:hypothetical protein